MKFSALLVAMLCALAIAIPLYFYRDSITLPVAAKPSSSSAPTTSSQDEANPSQPHLQSSSGDLQSYVPPGSGIEVTAEDVEYFKIYNLSTGKVDTVSVQDYVRGAVAAEMPATFHSEAMKAQAVSAHTYALYQHYFQQKNPDPALKGADFAADPANLKGYASEVSMRRRFGQMADEYWNKITTAADSVLGYVVVYEGEPIIAAYHAACAGVTEDAQNVWSGPVPYLVPVDSPGDLLAPSVTNTVSMSAEEVRKKLSAHFEDLILPQNPGEWISIEELSDSGYAVQVQVGNLSVHGKDLRAALDLKSTHVDIDYGAQGFTFTTTGYGHGVGLSQYGADYMARQGMTFDEILLHYYSGAELALFE